MGKGIHITRILICLAVYVICGFSMNPAAIADSKKTLLRTPKTSSYAIIQRQNPDTSSSDITPRGALLRSLVFPGWGQWYNGKKIKSAVIFSAEAGCIAGFCIQYSRMQKSSSDAEREFYRDDRNKFVWWFAGIVIYSMLDSYIDAYLKNFKKDMDINVVHRESGTRVTLNVQFTLPGLFQRRSK